MKYLRVALLLVAGCLLITQACLASTHPCAAATSRISAWTCSQNDRIKLLDSLLLSLVYDPSNLAGSTVQGYVQQRPLKSAEDLLLYASFSAEAKTAPLPGEPLATEASVNDEWYATEADLGTAPVLPKPSRKRQLLQFPHAHLFTNYETAGEQVTQETVSFVDPAGALHSYSNSYSKTASGSAGPLSAIAARNMQLPVVLSALAGPGQLMPLQPTLRIVGGVEAPTDRKYVCSLRTATDTNSNFLYCGCSLIAPGVVMTAAHCLMDLRTPWVEIGRYYQQRPNDTRVNDYDRIKCAASVINQKWGVENNAQGDIALCFLQSPSRFDPVKLAVQASTKLTAGQELTVMGWGATSEGGPQANSLMTVNVTTTDLKTCNSAFDNKIDAQTQLCAGVLAGGRDACQGDSGGPLVISGETAEDDVQVGIVSFGIGCARPNLPGVYTDVRAYRQWIAQQLLGRSIKYAPLTDGYTADVKVVDQKAACACTADGRSGSARLPNNLSGCKQHSLNMGDTEYYCYTKGGTDCAAATPSNTYTGAAWVDCTPSVAASRGPATATPATTTPATSAASLLGSLVGQWLATPRDGPNITMPFAGNGTAARNRTALLSRRAALPAARG